MILDETQIANIIKTNPQKALIAKGVEVNKKLRMHMYGEQIESYMPTISGFEKDAARQLRLKFTESNRGLFARLSRPFDKVFSAKGGAKYYNLVGEQEKVARGYDNNVLNGDTIGEWLKQFWLTHLMDDPAGIIFMEIKPFDEKERLKSLGLPYVYPTYKNIHTIYDYMPKGAGLEYVVFKVSAAEKQANGFESTDAIYRVVDDAYDYLVKQTENSVQILMEHSLLNPFQYVPALLNSDTVDPSSNLTGAVLSPFNEILEQADKYLLKSSIKITHDFLHGFPKYWEYADDCPTCNASGYKDSKECPDCKGTGKKLMLKVSDAKLLAHPTTKDDPVIAPNVAGYVSPDKAYWEISTADLSDLENAMTFTLWGATSKLKSTPPQGTKTDGTTAKTATEIMDDIKPQSDRLFGYSKSAENRHKFILDSFVNIQVNNTYKGSVIIYGKRYMIESADSLKEKYEAGCKDKLPGPLLDNLYLEYLETEFASDQNMLTIETKKMKVDRWFHRTCEDVGASQYISDLDKCAKEYFNIWKSDETTNDMWLAFDEKTLRDMLYAYAATKQRTLPPKPEPTTQPAFN